MIKRLLLILAFLLAAVPCWGQLPIPRQGARGATTCVFAQNVLSGSVIIASAEWETSNNTPSLSDTLTTSYSQAILNNSNSEKGAIYVGTTTSAGANTVTFSVTGEANQETQCLEVVPGGMSTTVDASGATFSTTNSGSGVVGNNITTTKDTDLLYCAATAFLGNTKFNMAGNFANMANNQGVSAGSGFSFAGANGNYNCSFQYQNSSSNKASIILLVAFAPSAIQITSPTALPDGALSNAYSYQMTEQGATASLTWSTTAGSFPPGLSMNSSGLISGTPLGSNSNTITVQVTDGTHTTTKGVTIGVGNSMNTVTHVKDSSGSGVFTGGSNSGDLIIVQAEYQAVSAAGFPRCTDTLGTVYNWFGYTNDTNPAGDAVYSLFYSGLAPSTGANTIACSSSPGRVQGAEFSNTQNFTDNISTLKKAATATTVTTNNVTTLVPNEILYAAVDASSGATVFLASAPFTSTGANNLGLTAWNTSTTVTTYSATFTWTTSEPSTSWVAAFRPTKNGTAPVISSGSTSSSQVY